MQDFRSNVTVKNYALIFSAYIILQGLDKFFNLFTGCRRCEMSQRDRFPDSLMGESGNLSL